MKPETHLPSNFLGGRAAPAALSVPAVSMNTGDTFVARRLVPKAVRTLAEFDEWARQYLRDNRTGPRAYRLALINWRQQYQRQQEAAELAANPAAAEELRLVAERLGRKAQSGFGGAPPTDASPA